MVISQEEALFESWKGTIERNPGTFLGKTNDLETIPISVRSRIIDHFKLLTDTKTQEKKFQEIQPYFYDTAGLWWLWDSLEYRWILVDEVDMLNMINDSTGKDVVKPGDRAVILNTLKQEGRKKTPKPAKDSWIQLHDQIIDVKTGDRFLASPEYFITNPLPWSIPWEEEVSANTPPMINKLFTDWVGEENVNMLYEILAYSMLADYPIHRIFCFIGEGMNGKSCFLNLLRKFIGPRNCCTTELDTLLSSRFELTKLYKKLICMMGEVNFNEMAKTSIIKKLTGQDLIGFEYKNKTPFDCKNYAKIIIATNNLPTTTDKTIGFYRRWMIIDFPNRFSEARDVLADIPEEEYNMLAIKCVEVLKELLIRRSFTNEGSIEDRITKYESKSNFLEKFVKEFTKEDSEGYITKSDFYKKFLSWSKDNKHREVSETTLAMSMKKLGIESNKKYFSWLYDGKGGQARVWDGISWVD